MINFEKYPNQRDAQTILKQMDACHPKANAKVIVKKSTNQIMALILRKKDLRLAKKFKIDLEIKRDLRLCKFYYLENASTSEIGKGANLIFCGLKRVVIKNLISKNGYFERELLIALMQPKRLKRFLVKKFYKKFLRIGFDSPAKANTPPQKPKINALERIGYCFEPIGLRSKLTAKFKQLTR